MLLKVKVLHLASFTGNIGDVANHEAFYVHLTELLNRELEIDKLEMRLFYRNTQQMKFDNNFADLVNSYDLLIIGGGNFFELCWDYSHTGTTFDISGEVLKSIKTPILINGIGIDIDKGYSKNNLEKFKSFLEILFSSNKVFFTVRNDGSKDVINRFFSEYSDNIYEIPDHGFFLAEVPMISEYKGDELRKYIGINVAIDMKEIRYSQIEYETFIKRLAEVINNLLSKYDFNIYLFPHIQSDYFAITELMKHINHYFLRTRISVTSLQVGNELETFKHYKECQLVIGMRNHSTICAIGLGVPSFGMTSYPKPEYIYNELGLKGRYLNISEKGFFENLSKEIELNVTNSSYNSAIQEQYNEKFNKLKLQKEHIYGLLDKWLREHSLK